MEKTSQNSPSTIDLDANFISIVELLRELGTPRTGDVSICLFNPSSWDTYDDIKALCDNDKELTPQKNRNPKPLKDGTPVEPNICISIATAPDDDALVGFYKSRTGSAS